MPFDALAQRIGKPARLLHEPRAPDLGHRVGLLPGQPKAHRYAEHSHAQPGHPVPVSTVLRQWGHGVGRVGVGIRYQSRAWTKVPALWVCAMAAAPRIRAKRRIAAICHPLEQAAAQQLVTNQLFGRKCRQRNTLMRRQL